MSGAVLLSGDTIANKIKFCYHGEMIVLQVNAGP